MLYLPDLYSLKNIILISIPISYKYLFFAKYSYFDGPRTNQDL